MRKPRKDHNASSSAVRRTGIRHLALALLPLFLLACATAWAGQDAPSKPATPALPEAPQPQAPAQTGVKAAEPCKATPAAAATPKPPSPGASPAGAVPQPDTQTGLPQCPPPPAKNWYTRFLTGPEVKPLTPKEKARLAARNLLDPFNAVTIAGNAGISVGSDAHSAYGPGMPGFGRYVGVSYAEDMTSEVFGTFLIPSIMHQDPHYHRMPKASIPRRALHAVVQIAWTQGDNGKGMLNYASLLGSGIENEIVNLYVPGQQTNGTATASRYAIGLATAPIDNFITEFLPDVARRIHVRIVLVQRIINQVATTGSPAEP
ncbi:MAG: hypothetical protein KGM96_00800 [Acidobacteriota bacterium]|nr:hypothetical protein [Acidobacteriota bacterium]